MFRYMRLNKQFFMGALVFTNKKKKAKIAPFPHKARFTTNYTQKVDFNRETRFFNFVLKSQFLKTKSVFFRENGFKKCTTLNLAIFSFYEVKKTKFYWCASFY